MTDVLQQARDALAGLDEAYCRAEAPLTRDERTEDRKRLIAARNAIAALDAAIAQRGEPVLWVPIADDGEPVMHLTARTKEQRDLWVAAKLAAESSFAPLYTAPPARAPLTESALIDAYCASPHERHYVSVFISGARHAERAHEIGA